MLQLLEPTTVKLNNVQTRMENHGDDQVLAIDLSVTWNTNNRALSAINKQLRGAFFCDLRQQADGVQSEMELPVDELPNVRLPGLDYPVKFDHTQMGARVEVAYGIAEESGVVLQLCKVSKFRITPIEGGSAEVKFAISSSADIDERTVGRLSVLQQHDISIKLTMPDVEAPAESPLTEADVFGIPPAGTEARQGGEAQQEGCPGRRQVGD
jgi:hypothetical protein